MRMCRFYFWVSFLMGLMLSLAVVGGTATAGNNQDASDVISVVVAVEQSLEREDFTLLGIVDHAANAKSVGLRLRPTQVIFARADHSSERKILEQNPTAGIDLTRRVLVYQTSEREIKVFTHSVGFLVDRHGLNPNDSALSRIAPSALSSFADFTTGLVTIESTRKFGDTVNSLLDDAIPDIFNIPLVIDYNISAKKSNDKYVFDRDRYPVLIVFGNPNVGTPLMAENQLIGADLPQKFLVWTDQSGSVNITYNDPRFLAERFKIEGQDARLGQIANALQNFALIGAGKAP